MKEYEPRPEQREILDKAMAHIRSVPYNVSARCEKCYRRKRR
jgi:hypothetical protein